MHGKSTKSQDSKQIGGVPQCTADTPIEGAHVAYNVVVVGRSHVQYGHIPRKRQRGPSFKFSAYVRMGQ